jgi:hypothetical protein
MFYLLIKVGDVEKIAGVGEADARAIGREAFYRVYRS